MYVSITDTTIECDRSWEIGNDHDPRYCDSCYLYYQPQVHGTIDDACARPSVEFVYEAKILGPLTKTVEGVTIALELAWASSPKNISPAYFRWIVSKLPDALYHDSEWDHRDT